MYNYHRHMHMNASISLSIELNIRLRLVGLSAWRSKTEIHNLALNYVFSPCRQADQHRSNSHRVVICTLVMLANAKF